MVGEVLGNGIILVFMVFAGLFSYILIFLLAEVRVSVSEKESRQLHVLDWVRFISQTISGLH